MEPDRSQRDRPAVFCYRPAVVLLHVLLISISYQQNENLERVSKASLLKLIFNIFKPCKLGSVCTVFDEYSIRLQYILCLTTVNRMI